MPTIYVIAGPNGVGKTTFAERFLPDEAKQLEFVNADLIARGLSPFDPDAVAMEAGRIALKRIRELIQHKIGFTFDAWKLYENDLAEPRLIVVEKQGRFVARDRKRLNEILTEASIKL